MDITERIKELCKERGWTYYKLSNASGIPHSSLNAMLNRQGDPSMKNLMKICAGLGITLTEFFAGMEEPSDDAKEIVELWNSLDKNSKRFAKTYLYGLSCRKPE